MEIKPVEIKIDELSKEFIDTEEDGCLGYSRKLNIRPKYQREFVYNDQKRSAVIQTVIKGFPLNTMYWSKNKDDTYEVIDGQQRTISICQFIQNMFPIKYNGNDMFFMNFQASMPELAQKILDYKVQVYICSGTEEERLDWFRTINIAGEKLNDQELRNATYTGSWLSSAKKYFSKNQCAAYNLSNKYVKGSPIRQDLLETALKWKAEADNLSSIEEYMGKHQNDENAKELSEYFEKVIEWIEDNFTTYRKKEMQDVDWGHLYNKYSQNTYNANKLEKDISELMEDDEIGKKSGIYEYVLEKQTKDIVPDERRLHLRAFSDKMKREVYEKQKGICPMCEPETYKYLCEHPDLSLEELKAYCEDKFSHELKVYDISEMQADHIIPWSKGGKTTLENCQLLCATHNGIKSDK